MTLKKANKNLLYFFLTISVVWPFYIDVRIATNVGINPQRLVLSIIIFIEVFRFIIARQKRIHTKLDNTWFLILLFFIIYRFAISVILANSLSLVLSINEIASIFILALIVVKHFTLEDLPEIGKILYRISFFLFVLTFYEFVTRKNPFDSLNTGGGNAAIGALKEKLRVDYLRAKGTFESPLTLMQYMLMSYPLSMIYINFRRRNNYRLRLLTTVIHMSIMFFTFSRFGLLALFCMVLFLYYSSIKSKMVRAGLVMFGVIAVPFMMLIAAGLLEDETVQLNAGENASVYSSSARVAQIVAGAIAVTQHPFLGYGLGDAGQTALANSSDDYKVYNPVIDNRILTVMIESGVLTALAFLWLFTRTTRRVRKIKEVPALRRPLLAMMYALTFSMFMLSIFTIYPIIFTILAILNMKNSNVRQELPPKYSYRSI